MSKLQACRDCVFFEGCQIVLNVDEGTLIRDCAVYKAAIDEYREDLIRRIATVVWRASLKRQDPPAR